MCKIKYFSFLKNISTICFDDQQDFKCCFLKIVFKFMSNNKIKKNSTTKIKEKIKKSMFDLLTSENDFLVKNLKKAG